MWMKKENCNSLVISIKVSHPHPAQSCHIHWGSTLILLSVAIFIEVSHPHPAWCGCIHHYLVTPTLLDLVISIEVAYTHPAWCGHIHWGQLPPPCSISSYTLGSAKLILLSSIIYISTCSPPPYSVALYALTSVLLTPLGAISYPSMLHLDTLSGAFHILRIYMLDRPSHVLHISYILGSSWYHPYTSGVLQAGSLYDTCECHHMGSSLLLALSC